MSKNRNKLLYTSIAILTALTLFTIPFFAMPTRGVYAAIPEFSNATMVESEIKNLFQSIYEDMGSEVDFKLKGDLVCKKFLETDASGNYIVYKDAYNNNTFHTTEIVQKLPDEQLMDMNINNYNAYTRMALKSYAINLSMAYTIISNKIVNMEITFKYILTWHDGLLPLAGRNAVINHANVFLNSSEYAAQTTDYEKIEAINKFICNSFQYDYRLFSYNTAEQNQVIYTAYNMLTDTGAIGGYPRGVCQAYAMYGYILLKQAGYETITIDGLGNGGDHAWNMVKIGNNWYHVDFTWNDPVSKAPASSGYKYMQIGEGKVDTTYTLRADWEMQSKFHTWDKVQNGYTYPTALNKHPQTTTLPDVTAPPPVPTSKPTAVPTKIIISPPTTSPAISSKISHSISSSSSSSETEHIATITIQPDSKASTTEVVSTDTRSYSDQTIDISGQIVDENNNPVTNVKIELFEAKLSSVTDINGDYKFNNVKFGKYKIYIKDSTDLIISDLQIEFYPGDFTELNNGKILLKGEKLIMDMKLEGNVLTIRSISAPLFDINHNTWLLIIVIAVIVILILLLTKLKRNNEYSN